MKRTKWLAGSVVTASVCLAAGIAACAKTDEPVQASLSFEKKEMTAYIGETFTQEVTQSGITDAIVWSSGNDKIATVTQSGEVSALAEGSTNIFAKANDLSAYFKVTVTDGDSLTVSESKVELVLSVIAGSTGETSHKLNVSATVKGKPAENPAFKFESSDPSKASVSADGTITAVAEGNATVTVSFSGGHKELKQVIPVTVSKARKEISIKENYLELGTSADTVNATLPAGVTLPAGTKLYDLADEDKTSVNYTLDGQTVKIAKYSETKVDGIDKYQLFSGERTLVFDTGSMEYIVSTTVYTKIIMTAQDLRGTASATDPVIERTKGIRFYSLHDRSTERTAYLAKAFVKGYVGSHATATGDCSGGAGPEWWNAADKAAGIPLPEGMSERLETAFNASTGKTAVDKGTTEKSGDCAFIYKFGGYFALGADIDMSVDGKAGNMYDWAGYFANGNNWEAGVIDLDSNNTDVFGFHGVIDGKGHKITNFKVQKNNGSALGINIGSTGVVRNIAFENVEMGQQQCGIVAFGSKGLMENITVTNCAITKADNANAGRYDARGVLAGKPEGGRYRNIFVNNVYYKTGEWGQYTGGLVGYGKGEYSDCYVIGTTKLCKDAAAENPRATDNVDSVKGFDTAAAYKAANISFSSWDANVWETKTITSGEGESAVEIVVPVLKVQEL